MDTMTSQITRLTIVYLTVYSAQIKENIKAPRHWPFVPGIHRWQVNSPHKWPVTRKMFPFDDVIMLYAPLTQCGLFSAKPLPEPMLTYCQLSHQGHTSAEFDSKYNDLLLRKCIWKNVACGMASILLKIWCVKDLRNRDHSGYGLGQWEKPLHSNVLSHWMFHARFPSSRTILITQISRNSLTWNNVSKNVYESIHQRQGKGPPLSTYRQTSNIRRY